MAKRIKDANSLMRDIKRKTRRKFSSEEKIRIVLDGLRGEESIAALCRREDIAQNLSLEQRLPGSRQETPVWRYCKRG